MLNTESTHYYNGIVQHIYHSGWVYTWRSVVVHWGEGTGGWSVFGRHFIAYRENDMILLGQEWVEDCSIYNGWWDKNK